MSEFLLLQNFDNPLGLIDVSFEDDCLYSSSSPPRDFLLFSDDLLDTGDPLFLNITDSPPRPQTSVGGDDVREPDERKQNVKCNLRTSLAWDSAFLNGAAGVLEPDELSSFAGESAKRGMLPGIREELDRSTDSLSTFASDGLTMDNLEGDLFTDIRASIQKSNRSSAVSKSMAKSPRMGSGMAASRIKQSPKTVEKPSPTKVTSRTTKKESASLSKIAGRVSISTAAKGPSLNRNRVKLEDDKGKRLASANAKELTGTIKPPTSVGPPRNSVSRLRPLLHSSSLSSTKSESVASSSSSRSESISSDGSIKSLKSVGRNATLRTGVPSGSLIAKATSRITSKSKNPSTIPHLKSSAGKISPSISPASSVSEWSLDSVSFSPTSPLNKRSNYPRSSIGSSSCGDCYQDDCSSQVSDCQSHTSEISAASIQSLPTDVAKPSGLRLPSPKMGFFDGERSSPAIKSKGNVQPQPGAPSGIPRPGTVVQGKLGKVQKAKTTTPVRSPKIGTLKQSLISPKSKSPLSRENPSSAAVAPKVGGISRSAKQSPGISPRVQSKTSPGDKNLKPMKVSPGDKNLKPMKVSPVMKDFNSRC
ncbi:hypothetical protein LINGRAHAP2_LOCUS35535 [Linum grandiflorum]